jgi:hypothetical protein
MDNLPASPLADFAKQARQHRRPQSRAEGGYLKFNGKTGEWTMGQEEVDVAGEQALIMSDMMEHGYVRWGEIPPAKAFARLNQPYPEKPEPVDGTDYEGKPKTFHAEEARQLTGKFMDDELGQFVFNVSSQGGVENVDVLFDAIIAKVTEGGEYVYPKVKLANEWYKRSTGKVYKPVFEIVGWCNIDGELETERKRLKNEDVEDDEPQQPDEAPRRKRRRVA